MAADVLATYFVRASATMVLIVQDKKMSLSFNPLSNLHVEEW